MGSFKGVFQVVQPFQPVDQLLCLLFRIWRDYAMGVVVERVGKLLPAVGIPLIGCARARPSLYRRHPAACSRPLNPDR